MASSVYVDDTDLTQLEYSNDGHGWRRDGSELEYNKTSHWTRTAGSSITFVFNGTYVEVYGRLPSASLDDAPQPITLFSLDSVVAAAYAPQLSEDYQYNQQMFQSAFLSEGEHTLVMNLTVQNSWFWLDYIMYSPLESTGSSSVVPSSTLTPSAGSQAAGQPSNVNVGAIVGAAIGGAAFFLAVGCLIGFLCYRRRKRVIALRSMEEIDPPNPFPNLYSNVGTASSTIPIITEPSIAADGNGMIPPSSKPRVASSSRVQSESLSYQENPPSYQLSTVS